MKIRADEHVPPEIVRAVKEMALSDGWELTSVIEVGDRGAADVHWITRFGNGGGNAIVTGDTDFLRRPHQVMAVHDVGLKIIHLAHKWNNARGDLKAAHILLWWKRIETALANMNQRECYRVPWNVDESADLMKIKVDYEEARKKVKKSARRAD